MGTMTIRVPAKPGEKFGREAFINNVGKTVEIVRGYDSGSETFTTATLTEVIVSQDGIAEITLTW